jgi:hypothetical protein
MILANYFLDYYWSLLTTPIGGSTTKLVQIFISIDEFMMRIDFYERSGQYHLDSSMAIHSALIYMSLRVSEPKIYIRLRVIGAMKTGL